jgi:nucleoid-associated protein YgaU
VNGLLCNGEFTESANIGDWLLGILPYFLLRETKIGGKFGLRPLLPTNLDGTINTSTLAPDWVLGESVIAPDSFSQEWSDAGTRLAPKLTMLWRQQSETDMPIVRSLAVGLDRAGPAEQHDLSRFCATEIHAARVGAYMHGRRYLSTHTAAVTLIPGSHTGRISQGDIVVVRLPLVTGREADGLISDWYAVESVAPSADGSEALTLSHFPVDSLARSLLALQVANAVAPGALLPFPAIGACDVAGRSADTSVPASSTSGTPFSSGGSGISATPPGGYVGGSVLGGGGVPGGGGYDQAPVPDYGPTSEEAPKSPPVNPASPGGDPGELANPNPGGYEDVCPNGTQVVTVKVVSSRGVPYSEIETKWGAILAPVAWEEISITPISYLAPYRLSYVKASDGSFEEDTIFAFLLPQNAFNEPPETFSLEQTGYKCDLGDGTPGPTVADRRATVVKGDTLYDIAGRLLGNVNRWPEIYELNTDIIENPDLIYPGQVLRIPAS